MMNVWISRLILVKLDNGVRHLWASLLSSIWGFQPFRILLQRVLSANNNELLKIPKIKLMYRGRWTNWIEILKKFVWILVYWQQNPAKNTWFLIGAKYKKISLWRFFSPTPYKLVWNSLNCKRWELGPKNLS